MPTQFYAIATIYIFVFAAGAAIGSFLNVLIYRLPRNIPFVRGFSHCPACGHRLFSYDIVPIISRIALRGRCRYCGAAISPRYTFVEAAGGALAILAWSAFLPPAPFLAHILPPAAPIAYKTGSAALYFAVLACLLAIAWIDAATMEIPDSLSIAIAALGVLSIFIGPDIGLRSHLIGIAAAAAPLFVLALFIEGAFGFGDVKLMAAAGLFLGWERCLVALFIGVIIGGAYGVFLLATKKKGRKDHFAFGPALCIGVGASMFFGTDIIGWYFGLM